MASPKVITVCINKLSQFYTSYLYSNLGYKKLTPLVESKPEKELPPHPPKTPDSEPKWFVGKNADILVPVYKFNILLSLALLFLVNRITTLKIVFVPKSNDIDDIDLVKVSEHCIY